MRLRTQTATGATGTREAGGGAAWLGRHRPRSATPVGASDEPRGSRASRGSCLHGNLGPAVTIAFFGDSRAALWFPAMKAFAEREGWRFLNHGNGRRRPIMGR